MQYVSIRTKEIKARLDTSRERLDKWADILKSDLASEDMPEIEYTANRVKYWADEMAKYAREYRANLKADRAETEHCDHLGDMWHLLDANGEHMPMGGIYQDFRGDACKLDGVRPPHKASSSGHVTVDGREVYAGVIGGKWVRANEEK